MNWIRTYAALIVMSYGVAWGATLTWNANTELDLAGYRVYQCSQQPCGRANGTATPLVTLGNVTSFNIGTPATVRYYVVTAYDFTNNESSESAVATYTPASSTPPPPTPTPVPPTALPSIGASPLALTFSAQQGGSNPPSQRVNISNTGGGALTWTASENNSWLAVSPATGTDTGAITITVTTGTRAVGTYSGLITLSASGASSVTIPVTFTVTAQPTPPTTLVPPPTPTGLRLTPAS